MDNVFEYEAYKFNQGSVAKVTDPLTVESPLQININDKPFTVVMQTPGDEIDLCIGLLFAENVISDFDKIDINTKRNEQNTIDLLNIETPASNLADGFLSSRSLLSVSSCGICGKRELSDLKPSKNKVKNELSVSFKSLFKMQEEMRQNQAAFNTTGGCHGVALFDSKHNLLVVREDIGRHNALDKSIGALIRQGIISNASILIFSGRISYEIVSKAFRAKIPLISAVSSPSSLAIDFAKEYGMTLVGFTRKDKATCYSNPNRISDII